MPRIRHAPPSWSRGGATPPRCGCSCAARRRAAVQDRGPVLGRDQVATEIARLLAAAEAGGIRLGDRPLEARDIAVLVNEHAQGTEVRNALQALGIACAQRSKDSVFHSPEAEQLECLLLALREPRRIGWVRAALATDFFGLAAHELAALTADGDPLETRLADFEHYHTLWRLHGFIHMFRRLVAECGIAARLGGFSVAIRA